MWEIIVDGAATLAIYAKLVCLIGLAVATSMLVNWAAKKMPPLEARLLYDFSLLMFGAELFRLGLGLVHTVFEHAGPVLV